MRHPAREKQETGRGYSPSKFKMFVKKNAGTIRPMSFVSRSNAKLFFHFSPTYLAIQVLLLPFFSRKMFFFGRGGRSFWTPFFLFRRVEKKLFFLLSKRGKIPWRQARLQKNSFLSDWYRAICRCRPPSNIGRSSLPNSSPPKMVGRQQKSIFSFHTFSQRINDLEKAKATKPISRKRKEKYWDASRRQKFFFKKLNSCAQEVFLKL